MKQLLKEKCSMFIVFILFYLLIEIITFIWVDFQFLPSDFLIDLVLAFAIASITFLIKSKKGSMIYLTVFFSLILFLFLINATMYDVYLDLFTIQQLQLIGEATDVVNFEHISLLSIFIGLFIAVLYFFVMRFAYRFNENLNLSIKQYYFKGVPLFLASALLVTSFFMIDTTSIDEFIANTNVTAFKRASLEKYGIIGYYTKEVTNLIEKNNPSTIPIDETNYAEPTEYFGLLEGKNVITILLESVQPFAINETLTPNMYWLADQGLYFENSYSENKTNHSELISILGNYPMTPVNFKTSTYDFSYGMPYVLQEDGYRTAYFHDNVETFYARGVLMPNLGFEDLYLHETLFPGIPIWSETGGWNGDYTLDSVTMEAMLPTFTTTDELFYTYWATMSSHGPYNFGPENKLLFEELGYFAAIDQAEEDGLWTNLFEDGEEIDQMRIRHYQAAVMDLDVAIGMMIDDLEDKGILDDTVIVLFGDHNVYYHEIYLKRFEGNNDLSNMEMYKNFFCIYSEDLTEAYTENTLDDDTTISTFVSPYNIVPTLFDLMGYTYDTDQFFGHSVFEETTEVFYSLKLTGFFNETFYSDNGIDITYAKEPYTTDQLQAFIDECERIKIKMEYINNRYIQSKTSIE